MSWIEVDEKGAVPYRKTWEVAVKCTAIDRRCAEVSGHILVMNQRIKCAEVSGQRAEAACTLCAKCAPYGAPFSAA